MFIKTRLTNNTDTNRAYGWFPSGLHLAKGRSVIVDYDPLSRIERHKALVAQKDIKDGNIIIEYLISAPCKVVDSFEDILKSAPTEGPEVKEHTKDRLAGKVLEVIEHDDIPVSVFTPDTPKEDLTASIAPIVNTPPKEFDISTYADQVTIVNGPKKPVEDKPAEEPVKVPAKPKRTRKSKSKKTDSKNTF